MAEEKFHNEFHRLTNLLVKRGFAHSTSYDSVREIATVEWTDDGIRLQKLLRQLFDVPNANLFKLGDRHIADFVTVVLSAPTSKPVR